MQSSAWKRCSFTRKAVENCKIQGTRKHSPPGISTSRIGTGVHTPRFQALPAGQVTAWLEQSVGEFEGDTTIAAS